MHELSVAQEILEIVKQYLPNPVPGSVKFVKLNIGRLSNILPESLSFCYEAITDKTPLDGSKLIINELPLLISCSNCEAEMEIEPPIFVCPTCGSSQIKIISGTELYIEEIELYGDLKVER
jgi:hydrogenase nickel incorporation protein HypA/HybF